MKVVLKSFFALSLLFLAIGCSVQQPNHVSDENNLSKVDSNANAFKGIAGVYRCWSFNVGGAGKTCTSPPLTLKDDGTYSMSSEQGAYSIENDTIILSQSKIRGPGKILAQGNQIQFEYDYDNLHQTVTYLKTDWANPSERNAPDNAQYVQVTLNIVFPDSDSVDGINTVSLETKDENTLTGEAIAYVSSPHTVTALFRKLETKPGIPTGKVYTVKADAGFGAWDVGEIDLTNVTDDVQLTIHAAK